MPQPETLYHNWPEIISKSLAALTDSHGCWTQYEGVSYLNAYVCDYKTPPELMVQLAVLVPIIEYLNWSGTKNKISGQLQSGLVAFYDEKLKSMVRRHPCVIADLDQSEEQKKDMVMDSWNLHHPLMNLAKLALMGDTNAEKLLMDSVDYIIRVARHIDYEWPVFYKMDTLEITTTESVPGEGGETDVAGSYAHLMLLVWKLTHDKKYLREAEKAAKKLDGLGFDIFYRANNTAFSAGAMINLFKETGDERYLKISYACLASIFKNVHLWECQYGHGKDFSTYFAVYPLNDAPYSAAYEELEVYTALSAYLEAAEGISILPSVKLLVSEFVRYTLHRIAYYYPTLLPENMISEEVKTGQVNSDLWLPVEDLQDGWNISGQCQEVYGAGLSFGIVPRQYRKIKGQRYMIYCDYPIVNYRDSRNNTVTFKVIGDPLFECRLLILADAKPKKEYFTVTLASGKNEIVITPLKTEGNQLEYGVRGDSKVNIRWK